MPLTLLPRDGKKRTPKWPELWQSVSPNIPVLQARGHRPLQMDFEQQLKALVWFHLHEHDSGRHLLQDLELDQFARTYIAPPQGIKKSAFFEAINTRGLEQLVYVYERLQAQATGTLPAQHEALGELVAIDGSLINAVLSMAWADYRQGVKKVKVHLGFDLNHALPSKIFFTDGKGDERPFVSLILAPGQTGVLDRYYQCHRDFDQWQTESLHFVCRIKARTKKTVIEAREVAPGSPVFFDALVLLGNRNQNQTAQPVRLVGYRIDAAEYWVATNRHDLPAEKIALIYKLRWEIEKFFGWWKQHLQVYHRLARSPYGFMVQIMAGLITYLLLAIYCHKHYQEPVSIHRLRELRLQIHNDMADSAVSFYPTHKIFEQPFAKT